MRSPNNRLGHSLDLEKEYEELKRYFSTLDIVDQRVKKKKDWELTYPCTTSTCPPPMKYKPKRRVKKSKKGKESDVYHDPSR